MQDFYFLDCLWTDGNNLSVKELWKWESIESTAEKDACIPPDGFISCMTDWRKPAVKPQAPQQIKSSVQVSGCACLEMIYYYFCQVVVSPETELFASKWAYEDWVTIILA